MSNINTVELNEKSRDPFKRVEYTTGLVLGEDEFRQEQFYLMERDRLHQRALHGYGTVCGLKVSVGEKKRETNVMVSPGMAINPKGETIRVTVPQCAPLNSWLAGKRDDILKIIPDLAERPGGRRLLPVYVVLCYHECKTDNVPIPSAPCRSQDETSAPSRVQDSFTLSLELAPPAQVEEDAVRCFGEFLRMIEISDDTGKTFKKRQDMETLLRNLFTGSIPGCSLPETGAPPNDDKLYLHTGEAGDILRAIFRIWVTELRPGLLEEGKVCSDIPAESCVLLGQLDVPIKKTGNHFQLRGDASAVTVTEDNRPILLHTRTLQEWLTGFSASVSGIGERREIDERGERGEPGIQGEKGEKGEPGEQGPAGEGLELDLTRITGLSWTHGGKETLDLTYHENPEDMTIEQTKKGLVVAFGKDSPGRGGQIMKDTLNEDTFQVFCENRLTQVAHYKRIRPEGYNIVPVSSGDQTLKTITRVTTGARGGLKAAAFFFSESAFNMIRGKRLLIVLKGDFILDARGHAIDAHFIAGKTPTGQLPGSPAYGIQGGTFESWANVIFGAIDVNTATQKELEAVDGLGKTLSARIIEYREQKEGGIQSLDELKEIDGFNEYRWDNVDDYLYVGPRE
jgi:hypothetical protein